MEKGARIMKTMTKEEKLALLKLPLDEKIKRTFNMRQEFYDLAKKIADWHTVTFKEFKCQLARLSLSSSESK